MPSPRVLVTGVNGFVGQHVAREFALHGHEVIGAGREAVPSDSSLPLFDYVSADLTQPWHGIPVTEAIIHLAGLSAVGPSFDDPQGYLDVNGSMVNQMASWARATASSARGVIVSSGAVYDATGAGPLTETDPVALSSPYVVSKLLVENLVGYYRRRGLDWVVARPFNHIGPGQGPGFLLPDLARQLLHSDESGGVLRVGDLTTGRDYTDVRDVARAYRLLVEEQLRDDWIFNVCSGTARTGQEILELLMSALGSTDVTLEVDESRLRPDDPRAIRGAAKRLSDLTGWAPEHSIRDCVADFVNGMDRGAAA